MKFRVLAGAFLAAALLVPVVMAQASAPDDAFDPDAPQVAELLPPGDDGLLRKSPPLGAAPVFPPWIWATTTATTTAPPVVVEPGEPRALPPPGEDAESPAPPVVIEPEDAPRQPQGTTTTLPPPTATTTTVPPPPTATYDATMRGDSTSRYVLSVTPDGFFKYSRYYNDVYSSDTFIPVGYISVFVHDFRGEITIEHAADARRYHTWLVPEDLEGLVTDIRAAISSDAGGGR